MLFTIVMKSNQCVYVHCVKRTDVKYIQIRVPVSSLQFGVDIALEFPSNPGSKSVFNAMKLSCIQRMQSIIMY